MQQDLFGQPVAVVADKLDVQQIILRAQISCDAEQMSEALEYARAEIARLREIRDVAKLVRLAQKNYFRTRQPSALVESKNLERQLDELLK